MAACIAHWKSASPAGGAAKTMDFAGTIWDRIIRHKQAVVEPRVRRRYAARHAAMCCSHMSPRMVLHDWLLSYLGSLQRDGLVRS